MNSFFSGQLEHIKSKWPSVFAKHGYLHYPTPGDEALRLLTEFLDLAAIWRKDETQPEGNKPIMIRCRQMASFPAFRFRIRKNITAGPYGWDAACLRATIRRKHC